MIKKIKFNKKVTAFAVIAVAVVLGGSFAAKKILATPAQKENIKLPETTTLQMGDLSQRVTASGTVKAADEHSIFIELSQEVGTVYAEVGDKVEEGQLLVTYNIADTKKELENKVTSAQINLENAQLALSDLSSPATGTELIELQSQVTNAEKTLNDTNIELTNCDTKILQAQTTADKAKTTMQNNEELLKVGGISQKEYDDSVQSYDDTMIALEQAKTEKQSKEQSLTTAQMALEKAKLNLENGQNKYNDVSTANSIKKQQNAVKTAQINLEEAKNNLSKLTEATYSPITGTVIESNAVEGQMLTDSTVMMKVADLSNLDVNALVSEYDIAKVNVGQKVEMTSDGIEGVTYTGIVTKIEPSASSQTTMSGSETVVPVTVHMNAPDDLVKPGFSFDMEIIVQDLSEVNYIPISAVTKEKDETTYVYIVDEDDTLKKQKVTLGTESDMYIQVIDGLTKDNKIISSPTDSMKEGTSIMDYSTTSVQKSDEKESGSSILDSVTPSGGGGGMQGGPGGGMQGGGRPR